MKKIISRDEFMKNQNKLYPCFMEHNGHCLYCGADIAEHLANIGENGTKLVTGCYKCNRSFCS